MTASDWWRAALAASPETAPEHEQPRYIDVSKMSPSEYAAAREDLGFGETSDYLGVQGFSRQRAIRNIPREQPSAMQEYAAQRAQLGIGEAPQSTAMSGIREFTRAQHEAAQSNSPRRAR